MKIILISSSYPSRSKPYLGLFVHELAAGLSELNQKVVVVSPLNSPRDEEKHIDNVEVVRFKYWGYQGRSVDATSLKASPVSILSYIVGMLWATFKQAAKKGNKVIHGLWAIPAGAIALLVGRVLRKPAIVSCLGSDLNIWTRRSPFRLVIQTVLRKADQVITVGEVLKSIAIRLGAKQSKTISLPAVAGISGKIFHYEDSLRVRWREEKALSDSDCAWIYLGRLANPKRLDWAIRYLATNPDIKLYIYGDGVLRPKLETLAASLDLGGRVFFCGSPTSPEANEAFCGGDFLIYPTMNEALPTTILESLFVGLPVIAANVGAIGLHVRSGFSGYLFEASDSGLGAIDGLLAGSKLQSAGMRANILRESALSPYSRASIVTKTLAIYEKNLNAMLSGRK